MIRELQIRNFKSIKALDLKCSRINVFIGEPNTGKSNILESIALLHLFADRYTYYREDDVSLMLRVPRWNQLFYNQNLYQHISVVADKTAVELRYNDKRRIDVYSGKERVASLDPDLLYVTGENLPSAKFALYRFRGRDEFPSREANFVIPPDGPNLLELIRKREVFQGLRPLLGEVNLDLDLTSRKIRLELQVSAGEGIRETLYLPYTSLSESLQRAIFYLAVVLGNKNMVIALDNPEAHMFPPHVKRLAELIAHDNGNQYFISTHSPYLLMTLLEKARKDELGVFLTYLDRSETKVKPLTDEQKEEILDVDLDVFFNLDKFLEETKEGAS
jgi:AAA15 family ATPase/GTPase